MMFRAVVRKIPMLTVALIATLFIYGCGGAKEYDKQNIQTTNIASQYTKPKIDILLVQDASGSMAVPISYIKPQLTSFLDGIDSKWDYHFTVVPLHKKIPMTSKWIVAQDCSTIIPSSLCVSKSAYNSSPANTEYGWINTTDAPAGNTDPGFTKIIENLSDSSMISTNFLRADAALAVIVVSNGDDISGMSYPADYYQPYGDGMLYPNPNAANAQASFNSFKSFLSTGIKPVAGLAKFYSVVAANNYSSCYGGAAWQGARYMNMSSNSLGVGGAWYDLCSGGLPNVLSNLQNQFNSAIQAFVFNYAVIPNQPIVSSIVVKKNGTVVPQSATNGWTYDGYKTNTNTAYLPYPTNQRTGYFLRMNGTAEYSGADVITIDYQKP